MLTRAFAASPAKLIATKGHGTACGGYAATFGGGLVGGDEIRLRVDVTAGARALLTTQASTKVYRSPHGTSAELQGRVGLDGLLVVAPDPVVCFAGARYRQVQRFHVEEGGTLVVMDSPMFDTFATLSEAARQLALRTRFVPSRGPLRSRIERRLADRVGENEQLLKRKRDHQKEMILGGMAISIPLFAIAAVFAGLAGILAVCATLAVIAIAASRSQ